MEHQSAVLLRRLNPYCARALEGAASLCQTRAHAEILPEHWVLKLLEQGEGDLTVLARRYEWDMDAIWQDLLAYLDHLPRSVRGRPQLSDAMESLLKQAWLCASLEGNEQIRGAHLLTAMIDMPKLFSCDGLWPLLTIGRSQLERLRGLLDAQSDERPDAQQEALLFRAPAGETATAPAGSEVPLASAPSGNPLSTGSGLSEALKTVLDKFTQDITAKAKADGIDPVYGRDNEIRQMVDILSRRRKNNPILVGEPGVGKTALVEGLALRIAEGNVPESLKSVTLRTLDLGLLQAGAGVKGEFEQRLKTIIDAVRQSPEPVMLFIDEAHTLIGAGNQAGGADAANLLKPALARGELRTIAATTWSEYKQYFERDAALERRFQMVKVDDPKDTYAWLDDAGRYRVKLDMDREGSESGYSYLWVRLAKPYAGETYGWHTPLLAGTEVSVAFDGGDPDRPYIAHAFHNSAHPDVVNRDNRSRNILRTPAQNELLMEDKRGEEHIYLTTEYGKTQLGEGRLVDGQDKPRGAGFELRTDEYGVIRVAKGLFISADGQQKVAGEVLDRETALKEIDLCLQQIAQLSAAAEAANALQADIASQSAMFSERLKPLNEMIHVSAPEGMAFTSGEHMQLTATKNVAVNAGGDISVGVMGNMTALAGEKLGLFARSGPLSLKSGEGPVEVQAQNGGMQVAAEKKLTLTSVSDISFAGKKRITLIGGGSYLKLEAGKIEYGTLQVYLSKVERTMLAGASNMPLNLPVMPLVDLFGSQNPVEEIKPVLRIADAPGINGLAQSGCKWQVVLAESYIQAVTTDEVLMKGKTDAEGKVLHSEYEQNQLAQLAKQYYGQLWLVIGHRAHQLYFNIIPDVSQENIKDLCALDAMGFHPLFNSIAGNTRPGEKLTQCIKAEQQLSGTMLESLRMRN
ncbi:DUF2345 domain-containing protein [Cronobacter malonaticus]|uniref:DUF2345 domain-containing protein n=1 Tax=Cronobacter malonaticus TaxID=413503 RepID=UPI001375801E|nr:DUF2345 domain-containing protein [Cronobacter malonaticus]NCH99210.1 DUF2345 domain-containing protein [Cronobacter malonaticus]